MLSLLAGLYPVPSDWPRNAMSIREVLREKFPMLQAAMSEYRSHLPFWRRSALDRAWDDYRLGPEGRQIDMQHYWELARFS